MKVDNTTMVPWNEKRKSVRITSDEAYGFGSVFVADIYHFPYGVSLSVMLPEFVTELGTG